VALVGHGHCLRVLASVYLEQDPCFGAQLTLGAGSVSVLGQEHGLPALESWNQTPG
jgi:broad specificity phosphatase PhoE